MYSFPIQSSALLGFGSPPELLPLLHPGPSSRCGDRSSPGEGCHRAGSSVSGVLQPGIRCSQGFGLLETDNRSLVSQSSGALLQVPLGDASVGPSVDSDRGLDGFDRSAGCLSAGSCSSGVRYLRFVADGQSSQFRVLCFGLTTAPQVFMRVMAPSPPFFIVEVSVSFVTSTIGWF